MSQLSKDPQSFRLTKKSIRSIAAYQSSNGQIDFVPLTGKVDPARKLLFEVQTAQPAYEFGVQIGAKVIPLGIQWLNAPERNWQALAERRAHEYYTTRDRELQDERRRNAAEKARKELLERFKHAEANPCADGKFNFAGERNTFCTPNRLVALKARDVLQAEFLDVVVDANNDKWYRFGDPDGSIRDTICPSCGDEKIVETSERSIISRVCNNTGCNFRWVEQVPSRCPLCQHDKLSANVDGNDVYLKCDNVYSCAFERRLGHLPRVPASAHEAERIAVGASDVEG